MTVSSRDEWEALSPAERDRYLDALGVLADMRDGMPIGLAAPRVGMTPRQVVNILGSEPFYRSGREILPRESDRLFRPMRVLTPKGVRDIDVVGSANASKIAAHWNAIGVYLRTGDTSLLRRFKPPFEIDPDRIDDWWQQGQLDFIEIYREGV